MNIKNNKGIFYGLLYVMVFGALSLKASQMSSFKEALVRWSSDKQISQQEAKGSVFVAMPFADVVTKFKGIDFKNLEQAQEFAKVMQIYALNEAEKTELMNANPSFKTLIAKPDVQAKLKAENPAFWNSWLDLLGRILKVLTDAARSVSSAAGNAASAASNAASAAASAVGNAATAASNAVAGIFSAGRTSVLNLSNLYEISIANPGLVMNGAEYDDYVRSISREDNLRNLISARRHLITHNGPSKTVTNLEKLYKDRYRALLPAFIDMYKADYINLNVLLAHLQTLDFEAEALDFIQVNKIDPLKLYYNLEQQRLEKIPYGVWLKKQLGCWDIFKKAFSCGKQ